MTDSLRILLEGLIDYAGLFPPAALTMEPTVKNYDAYRRGENSWFLARLVMPAARLTEFEAALGQLPSASTNPAPWRLTSPLGPNIEADIAKILEFNQRHAAPAGSPPSITSSIVIESVEMRAANAQEIRSAARLIPKDLQAYFEIPLSPLSLSNDLENSLAAIAEAGARAKVRTGGEAPEMFPSGEDLARFFILCARTGVAFKASAGLHRPMRGLQRYTYKPDSASGAMHGFLNVFLTAALMRDGDMSEPDAVELLAEQSPSAFLWEEKGAAWRNHCIGNKQLAAARKSFCLTVGSCSFAEPLDNLKALGLV